MSESNSPTPPVEPTPPGYNTPETPAQQQPGYGQAPQQPYQQAPQQQYSQPAAPQQYGQPGQQQYGQPVQQPYQQQPYPQAPNGQPYQQGGGDPAGTVSLNYWLSVFFGWIPALIFFMIEKGKNGLADDFHKQNLNFSIMRGIVGILALIPYIGIIFWIVALALFIIHIMAAAKAGDSFRRGEAYKFPFNLPLIK